MRAMLDPIIGGRKRSSDWRAARHALVTGNAAVWNAAFEDWLHSRLQARYLQPIELLRQHDSQSGEGFSIVSIHCSLIEFLESTVQGINYRFVPRDADLGPYEYRKSGSVFVSFLTKREPFNSTFDESLAWEFYGKIRCGLLHEAATKGGWLIWADGSTIIDRHSRILFRNNLHDALLSFIDWYREALPSTPALQEAFLRKFEALCKSARGDT